MKWPQQARVTQTIAKNATTIRKGFDEAFDTDAIVAAWFEAHPDKESMTTQGGRDWALANVQAKRKPVELALAKTYANGWSLGESVGKSRMLNLLNKGATAQVVDWSNWTPGMEPAAALVRPPQGLKRLLESRRITISDDVIHTKIDRIGTSLATGLKQGWTTDQTAKMINEVINDPQHALVISRTETTRAVSVATRQEYEKNNVEMVEWLVAEGCEDCQENADASPIGIDETFPTGDSEPPAHPNCLCAIAPVFDDSDLPPAEEFVDEDGAMAEAGAESLDTGNSMDEVYEEATDSMRADELSRYQNYDSRFAELLGLKNQERFDSMLWDTSKLTPAGRALQEYKETAYSGINTLLRNPKEADYKYDGIKLKNFKKYITGIDEAMKVAPPLPNNLLTFRGVNGDNLVSKFKKLKAGDSFTDKGFGSTSMDEKFVKEWIDRKAFNGKGYIIQVENPQGTKGIMLDGLQKNQSGEESEWLLPRGTKYEVVSNDVATNTIRVRVVQ